VTVLLLLLQGMPESDIDEEVTSILTDIDLLDKADAIAEKLSGGQKRKLSVGM
jgi:ABC-type methionine transport system ATPase subunit